MPGNRRLYEKEGVTEEVGPRATPTGQRCVGRGQPIYTTNTIQRIGVADLHDACAEQFGVYADGSWKEISEEVTQ